MELVIWGLDQGPLGNWSKVYREDTLKPGKDRAGRKGHSFSDPFRLRCENWLSYLLIMMSLR